MKKVWQPQYQRVSTIGVFIVSGVENRQDIGFGIIGSIRIGDGKKGRVLGQVRQNDSSRIEKEGVNNN